MRYVLCALLALGITACGVAGNSSQPLNSLAMTPMAAPPADQNTLAVNQAEGGDDALDVSEQQPTQERVILRNAEMRVSVENAADTVNQISTMADEMGGWIVSANTSVSTNVNGDEFTTGNVTVRVPAERFEDALAQIRENSLTVENENITGQDVTQEYVDLSSRLQNLQRTETQLQAVMDDAFQVEDILSVQRELTRIREEIEVIQGRLRFYDQSAAFSSIAVTARTRVANVGTVEVGGWNPLETAQNAFGALIVVGQFLVDTAIVIVILGVPFVVAIGVPVWALRRWWKRRRPQPAEEAA